MRDCLSATNGASDNKGFAISSGDRISGRKMDDYVGYDISIFVFK
jgi:hypothetical protein